MMQPESSIETVYAEAIKQRDALLAGTLASSPDVLHSLAQKFKLASEAPSPDPDAFYWAGHFYNKIGDHERAKQLFETAVAMLEEREGRKLQLDLFVGFYEVTDLKYSPNGRWLAVADKVASRVVVYALPSFRIRLLEDYDQPSALTWAPGGDELVYSWLGSYIRRVDVTDGYEVGEDFEDLEADIECLAVSRDGRHLAAGCGDGALHVWDFETGQLRWSKMEAHKGSITSIAFLPDGLTLVTLSSERTPYSDQAVRFWNLASREQINCMQDRWHRMESSALSPDGKLLAASSGGPNAQLFDVASGNELHWLPGHKNYVREIAFSDNGKWLATEADNGMVRVWNPHSGLLAQVIVEHAWPPVSMSFSVDGANLAVGSNVGVVNIWDVSSGRCVRRIAPQTNEMRAVDYSPDGNILAMGAGDGSVRLWDLYGKQPLRTLKGNSDTLTALHYSRDGQRVFGLADDGNVFVWDIASGQIQVLCKSRKGPFQVMAFSSDDRIAATLTPEFQLRLWDLNTGHDHRLLRDGKDKILHAAFSLDGQTIITTSKDPCIRLWSVVGEEPPRKWDGHTDQVNNVVYSPDGAIVATASIDKTVRLWDARSGVTLHVLYGHTQAVNHVAFSADGTRLASSARDGTLRIWDVASGAHLATCKLSGWVTSPRFSPSGRFVAFGGGNGCMIADVASGKRLITLRPVNELDAGYAFTPELSVEFFGNASDIEKAKAYFRCRVGQFAYPFDLREQKCVVPGLLTHSLQRVETP